MSPSTSHGRVACNEDELVSVASKKSGNLLPVEEKIGCNDVESSGWRRGGKRDGHGGLNGFLVRVPSVSFAYSSE
jgi:hypothetical protein